MRMTAPIRPAPPRPRDSRLESRAERVALAQAIAAMTPEVPQSDSTTLLREGRDP